MFEIHPSNWPLAVDSTDTRNQFHERALHEARIATEHRQGSSREAATTVPARAGLVTRLRLAIAGSPAVTTTEACNCPA